MKPHFVGPWVERWNHSGAKPECAEDFDFITVADIKEYTEIPTGLAEASLRILHKKKLDATGEDIVKRNISVDPNILSGVPVVSNTRIPVYLILGYLSDGCSFSEIKEAFPSIENDEQIKAAVLFASEMCYSSLE